MNKKKIQVSYDMRKKELKINMKNMREGGQ